MRAASAATLRRVLPGRRKGNARAGPGFARGGSCGIGPAVAAAGPPGVIVREGGDLSDAPGENLAGVPGAFA